MSKQHLVIRHFDLQESKRTVKARPRFMIIIIVYYRRVVSTKWDEVQACKWKVSNKLPAITKWRISSYHSVYELF